MVKLGFAVVALVVACASPVFAQSAYDGPLAAPDTPVTTSQTPPHHAKPKAKKARHAAAKPPADAGFGAPAPDAAREAALPAPKSVAPKSVAEDPLSLDMKWNGNNDSVAQTRSQNLDGNAFGSGAEVGMKLHF